MDSSSLLCNGIPSSRPSGDPVVCSVDPSGHPTTDYPELHVVFDFFADNPQKVMPSQPDVARHGGLESLGGGLGGGFGRQENPFYDPYWDSIRVMQESQLFLEGVLLKSVDCKPYFPYIHYIIYKNTNSQNSISLEKTKLGLKSQSLSTSSGSESLYQNQLNNGQMRNNILNRQFMDILRSQGGYREMHTFVARRTPLLPKRPSNPNTAFIVSAFKTAGNLESLDRTWTYWSGADYIVENIPKSLKLERVTFHKLRHCPKLTYHSDKEQENFSYVLLCEIGEALADMNRAREFIDTLKYRQCGFTSMYVIDHFF